MKHFLTLLPVLAFTTIQADESNNDFLRFINGDTLHGRYLGLDKGPIVRWQSNAAADPISFETSKLRKLSLNNGRAKLSLDSESLVELSNKDRLPGTLLSLDAESVVLQTQFAGTLTIPKSSIIRILPNRHGGDVLYSGPFNDQGWEVPRIISPGQTKSKDEESPFEGDKEKPEKKKETSWVYGSAAWFSNSTGIIRLNTELPDIVSVRFELAWKPPLNAELAFFSDLKRPLPVKESPRVRKVPIEGEDAGDEAVEDEEQADNNEDEEAEKKPIFADIMEIGPGKREAEKYGSGYLLTMRSNYSRLQRLGFDENLKTETLSFSSPHGSGLNLGDTNSAQIEIRADRRKGHISLFVDGTFRSEWNDLGEPLDDVPRYFSLAQGAKTKLRISNVVISEWNGMPDSARSMQTEDRDVLLFTNGTDRISGKVLKLEENIFHVDSGYGIFQVPKERVTDIHFARESIASELEEAEEELLISLQPNGRLSIQPDGSEKNLLKATHPILGEMNLNLDYAYLLEFDPIQSIFDNWDDEL